MESMDILSLEEELTHIESDGMADEEKNAKSNYRGIDQAVLNIKAAIPYPDVNEYTRCIDYEDHASLSYQKRANKRHEDKIKEISEYANDGSLYCGHVNADDKNIYIMDTFHPSRTFVNDEGKEFLLVNVNDKKYQTFVNKWRFPLDYDQVTLSRNVVLKHRKVKDVDVVLDASNEMASNITDGYLRKALLRNKDENAQSIIQTIQRKQDHIRAYDVNKSFVVQGCAGSGKTMVLLHRLRYLLFNDYITEKDYVFLIPGEGFKEFITKTAQKMNIHKNNIFPYVDYYAFLLGKDLEKELEGKVIQNELVFDADTLQYIYSDTLIKDAYRYLFENVSNQMEQLLQCCEQVLLEKSEQEFNVIQERFSVIEVNTLKEINNIIKPIQCVTGIVKLTSFDETKTLIELLQEDIEYYRTQALKEVEEVVAREVQDDDERLLSHEELLFLQSQIDKETQAFEKASRFTKFTHKRKLNQLQQKYDTRKEELKQILKESEDSLRVRSVKSIVQKMSGAYIKKFEIIIVKLNQVLAKMHEQIEFYQSLLDQFDDYFEIAYEDEIALLNTVLEENEVPYYEKEFVQPLLPCSELLHKVFENGSMLYQAFYTLASNDQIKAIDKLKLFVLKTKDGKELKIENKISMIIFNEIKKQIKNKYNISINKIYKHYWYLQLYAKYLANNVDFVPRKYLFMDETQDLSISELELIYKVNTDDNSPIINLFGDVNQTISTHGIANWNQVNLPFDIFTLDENFRNTNQTVEFCNNLLPFKMKQVGVDMDNVKVINKLENIIKKPTFIGNDKIFIVKDEYAKNDLQIMISFMDRTMQYQVFTVKEVKGLEFKEVYVFDRDMTYNEKYIAYTRPLIQLNVIKELPLLAARDNLVVNEVVGEDEDE